MKKQNRPEKWSQDRLKYLFCKRTPVSAFQISAVLAVYSVISSSDGCVFMHKEAVIL